MYSTRINDILICSRVLIKDYIASETWSLYRLYRDSLNEALTLCIYVLALRYLSYLYTRRVFRITRLNPLVLSRERLLLSNLPPEDTLVGY